MIFQHRYAGTSTVRQADDATAMSFAPDLLRAPTYFRGRVTRALEFREAMSALHDVVVADLRFVPRDRTSYLAWRERQAHVAPGAAAAQQAEVAAEMARLGAELTELDRKRADRHRAFHGARQRYFDYLYQRDRDLWFKLDPIITVHPDQVFFECFSRDESSYGRLAASYDVFDQLGERANGTTNIDYSQGLYDEFQKVRSYKTTTLDIDPSGFGVETALEERFREVKIDVPDSWVRGLLQVSSAMTLPTHVVDLHPMDVHNLCFVLRRNQERFGPRSLRWQLTPGAPATVVVEPWGIELRCPRSIYRGDQPAEIRMWGRRRLHVLERLLPRARRVRLHLLGTGQPTFWVVDLGALTFTLGLSGWTRNDWAQASNFDLMAAREDVDLDTQERVFAALGKHWRASPDTLASELNLSRPIVASALAGWVQCGRAVYDLDQGVYRKRELTGAPLPVERLRYASAREAAAGQLVQQAKIAVDDASTADGGLRLVGRLMHRDRLFTTELVLDVDRRLVAGECSCDHFVRNRLLRGPCEHMLALRAAHRRGVSDLIDLGDYQATCRQAVAHATTLRAGDPAAAVRALTRAAKLVPAGSPEWARLQEVLAETHLAAGDRATALAAAERALRVAPTSPLALRIQRALQVDPAASAPPAAPAADEPVAAPEPPKKPGFWRRLVGRFGSKKPPPTDESA